MASRGPLVSRPRSIFGSLGLGVLSLIVTFVVFTPLAKADVCVPTIQGRPPACALEGVNNGITYATTNGNLLADYTLMLASSYSNFASENSVDLTYDVDLPIEIVAGSAGLVVDENTQGNVVDCMYTVRTANGTTFLNLSTTSGPCGGSNRNERCYSSTVTVRSEYPGPSHTTAWAARLYKTWCGIPGIKITRQDASTDSTIGTCWSGPQFPAHKTKTYTRTHAETTMTGVFTFECGFLRKQMNLEAGVEFFSNGSRKKFNRTSS